MAEWGRAEKAQGDHGDNEVGRGGRGGMRETTPQICPSFIHLRPIQSIPGQYHAAVTESIF